jgi:ArsR family transcriptional regulator, nickel/cobalt-responsive transcriptional repressor
MSHGPAPDPVDLTDRDLADQVAGTMQALATGSRLRILASLSEQPRSVGELSASVEMETSAVSHQLRILRGLGLVASHREGQRVVYRLYDEHVAELLGQAMSHVEHLRLGLVSGPKAPATLTG